MAITTYKKLLGPEMHCVEYNEALHAKDCLSVLGHHNLYECPKCGHSNGPRT